MSPEEFKNVLAVTVSISTILQFASGILICRKFVKKGNTGDASALPFITGCLTTLMWLKYGTLIKDPSVVLVNRIGAFLFGLYIIVFIIFTSKKIFVLQQVFLTSTVIIITLFYCRYETDEENAIKYVGFMCCCVTLLFFAAPLATLYHVLAVKSTESLPFPLILTTFFVCIQWFLYGAILEDKFIQLPNLAGWILSGVQLSLFYIYRGKHVPVERV